VHRPLGARPPWASVRLCGYSFWHAVISAVCHFGLSCLAAWLGFSLTSTILWYVYWVDPHPMVAGSILPCSVLASLCSAVLAHIVEDYYLWWF